MTSHAKLILASCTLLMSTLACVTLLGEPSTETNAPQPVVTNTAAIVQEPTVEAEVSCSVITDKIMQIATSGSADVQENLLDSEVYLVTYKVSGDKISNPQFEKVSTNFKSQQSDSTTQQQVWEYFTALIPADQRGTIAEYSILTDGRGGTLAGVIQTQTDPDLWALEVDIADTKDYYDLTYTLVHEFGHLLTLGPDQMPPSLAVFNNPDDNDIYLKEVSACPNYFPGEGCANSDSYINAFYKRFWVNIHEEWNKINLEEGDDAYYKKLDAFYAKYQDQFVTDYAPTNPEEDIAESWSFFVLGPKPANDSIASEKILFFYQYPELVKLRADILANLCTVFPQ